MSEQEMGEDLRGANEQLRVKYKKALQELMHILKVNKSLKEYLDQSAQARELSYRQEMETLRHAHRTEVQRTAQQIEAANRKIQADSASLQQLREKLQNAQTQTHALQEELKRQTIRSKFNKTVDKNREGDVGGSQQLQILKRQNESLKKKFLPYFEYPKEKESLVGQIEDLKEKQKQLTLQLLAEKEKFRSEIFSKETEYLRSKESNSEKLNRIESKYHLLQSELNNYKTVEKYFEEEAKIMVDEEHVFNSIREQIDKINDDFNKYELESSQLLLKKREEDQIRNKKIAELEDQLQVSKIQQLKLHSKINEQEPLKLQLTQLKEKLKQQIQQKQQILQKNHVLEALLITQKHRDNTGVSERIRQFEIRMKLLLEEQTQEIQGYGGLQQIIMLKGYIKQLSETVNQGKKRQEHLSRKATNYKGQLADMEKGYRLKIEEYKKRITHYDTLVSKLYHLLEEKLKERIPEQIEKEFNEAISHYEEKMLNMSEQIISLRKKKQEIEGYIRFKQESEEKTRRIDYLQKESLTYQSVISELSIKLNDLQNENSSLCNRMGELQQFEEQLKDKNRIIDQLAIEMQQLTISLNDFREQESNMHEIIKGYEKQLIELKEEIEAKDKHNAQLSRQSIDMASLIQKVNFLEYELNKARTKSIEPSSSSNHESEIKTLEKKISLQSQQIKQYKEEIDKLYFQLKIEKTQKHSNVADQYSTISELQRKITDLEKQKGQLQIKMLSVENEFRSFEIERKEEIDNLKYQNRSLSGQLSSKHDEMMVYYEQLQRKIANENSSTDKHDELQEFIAELQQKNHDIIERSTQEIKELNSQIIGLRTNNITLRNELEGKEDVINELKHQLFNAELRSQKEKSISGSMVRESIYSRDDTQAGGKNLMLLVLTFAEVQSLRKKLEDLEIMYHEDLTKYQDALKKLQTRQLELCNSLQLSSTSHNDIIPITLPQSNEEISQVLPESATYMKWEPAIKVEETTIRSYQVYPDSQIVSTANARIASSGSIQSDSPLKRRALVIKKI